MRRKQTLAAGFVALVILGFPEPARADFWDFLQEWSGPGPFNTRGNLMTDVCWKGGKYVAEYSPEQRDTICFFADLRLFENDIPDNFGDIAVNVTIYEFGLASRVHRSTEVGFGMGGLRFSAGGQRDSKTVLTVPRVLIRPALLYRDEDWWRRQHPVFQVLASVVKFYVKGNVIVGTIEGKDFGLIDGQPNFNFKVNNERVISTGFIIDLSELVWRGQGRSY